MRIHNRCGHQLGGFARGVAEHEALVAGALLGGFFAFGFASVHTLGDVGALGGDGVHDEDLVGMEHVVIIGVANFSDGFAGDGGEVQLGASGNFAAHNNEVAFGVGFASDAAGGILGEAGVEDGIGDGIADFVGMAFTDGFGGEDVFFAHKDKKGVGSWT